MPAPAVRSMPLSKILGASDLTRFSSAPAQRRVQLAFWFPRAFYSAPGGSAARIFKIKYSEFANATAMF